MLSVVNFLSMQALRSRVGFQYYLIPLSLRLYFLRVSKQNEKRIRAEGGTEKGKKVSAWLQYLFILYYIAVPIEGYLTNYRLVYLSAIGIGINLFGSAFLYKVQKVLGKYWTVKLMIAKDHPLIKSSIYKYCKHPNYYLNIIPEITGLALIFQSWRSFSTLGSAILYLLYLRIKEENVVIDKELVKEPENSK